MWGRWPQEGQGLHRLVQQAPEAPVSAVRAECDRPSPQITCSGLGGKRVSTSSEPTAAGKGRQCFGPTGTLQVQRRDLLFRCSHVRHRDRRKPGDTNPGEHPGRPRNQAPKRSSSGGTGIGRPVSPAGASSSRDPTRWGWRRASSTATEPPIEAPIRPKGALAGSRSSSASRWRSTGSGP